MFKFLDRLSTSQLAAFGITRHTEAEIANIKANQPGLGGKGKVAVIATVAITGLLATIVPASANSRTFHPARLPRHSTVVTHHSVATQCPAVTKATKKTPAHVTHPHSSITHHPC